MRLRVEACELSRLNDGVSIANHEFEIVILLTHMSVRRRIGCLLINLPLIPVFRSLCWLSTNEDG